MEKMGDEFAVEYKLDGERAQIHKDDEKIIIFSRSLENITSYYPDIVENIGKLIDVKKGIFETEIVAINENTGDFLPFQELMHRRRKYKIKEAVSQYPITVNFFDVLFLDDQNCLGLEYIERRKILEKLLKENITKLRQIESCYYELRLAEGSDANSSPDKLVNECKNEFDSALNNDFNTPVALTAYY